MYSELFLCEQHNEPRFIVVNNVSDSLDASNVICVLSIADVSWHPFTNYDVLSRSDDRFFICVCVCVCVCGVCVIIIHIIFFLVQNDNFLAVTLLQF